MPISDFVVAQPEEPSHLSSKTKSKEPWNFRLCGGIRNVLRSVTFFSQGDWYKGYFSLLLLFPKTVFVAILASCFAVGTVGLLRRNHVKDMHDLYTMRGSEEMMNYKRTNDIWNGQQSGIHVIMESYDPNREVWSLKALHYGGWMDAAIRHFQVNRNRLRDMNSMTSMRELRKQADLLADDYLVSSVPLYDDRKLVCSCPICNRNLCLDSEEGVVVTPGELQRSPNKTLMFDIPNKISSTVSFEEICSQKKLFAGKAMFSAQHSSYGCVAMTPFMLIGNLKNVLGPDSAVFTNYSESTSHLSPIERGYQNIILGWSERDDINVSGMLFLYQLKTPADELERADSASMELIMQSLIRKLSSHNVNYKGNESDNTWIIQGSSERSLQDALDATTALDNEMKIRLGLAVISVFTVALWGLGLKRTIMIFYKRKIKKVISSKPELEADGPLYLIVLTLSSILAIVSSGFAGSGVFYLCKLPHVPASESVPFMILGIGLDDFFVVWNSYIQTFQSIATYSPENRVLKAYKKTAHSVTLSTVTTILSFLIGCANPFWHIQIYSANVAVCLLFLYLAVWTMFPIILHHHAQRHIINAEDLAEETLLSLKTLVNSIEDKKKATAIVNLDFSDREVLDRGQLWWRGPVVGKDSTQNKWMNRMNKTNTNITNDPDDNSRPTSTLHTFSLMLLHPSIKAAIISLCFLTTTLFIALICLKLRYGLALVNATPFSSDLRKFLRSQNTHFTQSGDEFTVTFSLPTRLVEKHTVATFRAIESWNSDICENDDNLSISSYKQSIGYCYNPVFDVITSIPSYYTVEGITIEQFYEAFNRISSRSLNPVRDIIYGEGTSMISIYNDEIDNNNRQRILYRMKIIVPVMKSTVESWEQYEMVVDKSDNLKRQLMMLMSPEEWNDLKIYPDIIISSRLLPMWAADTKISFTSTMSLMTAMLSVTLCSYFLLGRSLLQTIIILHVMILIDIHLVGIMVLTGETLNLLTMITLLMAQGFNVDYLAHMCHAFSQSKLRNNQLRVQSAVLSIGESITQAAATTLTAILCLILSDKYTLRVFCRMVFTTICCAYYFSMVYCPVILGFLSNKHHPYERKLQSERADRYDIDPKLNMTERKLVKLDKRAKTPNCTVIPAGNILLRTATPTPEADGVDYMGRKSRF